jgi:hypothetical protein
MIMAVALCATDGADGRARHRGPKGKATAVTAPATNIPEKNRHPDDVALDRKIKGICKGC